MNDVEKFIENIEKVSIADSSGYVLVPEILYSRIMSMLKELEAVVRCKDCKHQDPDRFNDGSDNYVCRKGHGWKPDDWFCADGVKRDE